jgi:hypothetical protein
MPNLPRSSPLSDKIREKIKAAQTKFGGGNKFLSLEAGKPQTVFVLTGEYGPDGLFYRQSGIHYLGKEQIICPRIAHDAECPLCAVIDTVKEQISGLKNQAEDQARAGDKDGAEETDTEVTALEQQVDEIYPSKKWLFNVLVKGETKPRVFTAPWTIFKEVWGTYSKNANDEGVDILNPEASFAWVFGKTGANRKDVKYEAQVLLNSRPLIAAADGSPDEAAIAAVLEARYNLDEEVKSLSFEEIDKAYQKFLSGDQKEQNKPSNGSFRSSGASRPSPRQEEHQQTAKTAAQTTAASSLAARLKNRTT